MRRLALGVVLALLVPIGAPAAAKSGPSISGGGSADDMTRFALAINGGSGHFECLMPGVMAVQATVTGVDAAGSTSASFHGLAGVNLSSGNPFGLPAGPMVRGAKFTATVTSGGPGVGTVDLEILGMSFKGTVEHGHTDISP